MSIDRIVLAFTGVCPLALITKRADTRTDVAFDLNAWRDTCRPADVRRGPAFEKFFLKLLGIGALKAKRN